MPGAVARPRLRFPRAARLTRRVDFLAVQQRGRRLTGTRYLLFALARAVNERTQPARLGITVSKKVGQATVRNRVKRWLRESYRHVSALAPCGLDLVVVARPDAASGDYRRTSDELRSLLLRLAR